MSKGKNVALWVVTVLLALLFVTAGLGKVRGAPEVATTFQGWGYSLGFMKFIGVCELLGAVGLFIPRLTAAAASGLAMIIAGAIFTHATHREFGAVAGTVVLLGLLVTVAWARLPRLLGRVQNTPPSAA